MPCQFSVEMCWWVVVGWLVMVGCWAGDGGLGCGLRGGVVVAGGEGGEGWRVAR